MQWNPITTIEQLDAISAASFTKPQIILKHSTTCNISKMALARLERSTTPADIDFNFLDLLNYRSILIKNGACVYDESHGGIQMEEIAEQAAK